MKYSTFMSVMGILSLASIYLSYEQVRQVESTGSAGSWWPSAVVNALLVGWIYTGIVVKRVKL